MMLMWCVTSHECRVVQLGSMHQSESGNRVMYIAASQLLGFKIVDSDSLLRSDDHTRSCTRFAQSHDGCGGPSYLLVASRRGGVTCSDELYLYS